MFGMRDREYGWSSYNPDPSDWPFLQSISCHTIECVSPFIPGRPIRRITVSSQSPTLKNHIHRPVESVRVFKMLAWDADDRRPEDLAKFLFDLHDMFPKISTLLIGNWELYWRPLSARVPPLFTDTALLALGQFKDLRTFVCPIWAMEGETESGTYDAEMVLSHLSAHCPTLRDVFLSSSEEDWSPRNYEHWSRRNGTGPSALEWKEEKWDSSENLVEYVDAL